MSGLIYLTDEEIKDIIISIDYFASEYVEHFESLSEAIKEPYYKQLEKLQNKIWSYEHEEI